MNIRELEYLVAVAELKHFGKAAYKCCVSQPTLSSQIKKLENELGMDLFERSHGKTTLNKEGEEIATQARKILAEVTKLEQLSESFKDPFSGTLRLGIFPTLSPYLLPYIIKGIKDEFPKLEVLLVEDQTSRIEAKLENGELDVLILALPVENEKFEIKELFSEPFYLAVPKGHELSKKRSVSYEDIDGKSMLLLEDGHCLRAQVLDVCHTAGANEFSGFRATSMEAIRQMVAAGTGITMIPELAVARDLSNHNLIKYLPFKKPKPHRNLGLVWRKSTSRQELFDKLGDIIQREANKALK